MRMSSWALAPAPPAKNVVVYRNGDPFFPGRRLVVSPRRFLTFEAFLTEVTRSVGAPLAVRNLYTPQHGHRIAALGDLQDGHQYVAAGFEKFKKLDYLRHGRTEPRGTRKGEGLRLRAAAPWKPDIRTRWQRCGHLPRTIHVFRNGDLLSPPFPVPLPQGAPRHWDALLATLTERAALRSGAVGRLCRLDGTPMSCEEELRNGGYYVAVGNEEYKKLPYFELLVPQDSGCGTLRNHPNSRRGKLGRRFGDLPAASRVGAGGAALAEPPQQVAVAAGSGFCVPCVCFTHVIECRDAALSQLRWEVLGEAVGFREFPCQTFCYINRFIEEGVMDTLSWALAAWGLQSKLRSQLLFHSCKGEPGNITSKEKSPFSTLNPSLQDEAGGATGLRSKKAVSIKPGILGRRHEVSGERINAQGWIQPLIRHRLLTNHRWRQKKGTPVTLRMESTGRCCRR
ncbi:doublecortin domain-containing protein 2B isoform X2 [Cuculus canorus]|uniref:doublecortin domain-containing protein 2B isoform X2 n=1 Tax=Cuculus canorus TaxID=55661 RepID=UPI0023AB2B41|nr:doublecortin domain-containing protein 2B isoform X2 [Cuculus canorus]